MLRTVLVVGGSIALIVVLLAAAGYLLPVSHVASRQAAFDQPPARVFEVLRDVERYPAWRSDVTRVEMLVRGPLPKWREHGSDPVTFEMTEVSAPGRLVIRIADPTLPFGGTWTFALTPAGSGTSLVITENGEVYNPIFRVLSRYVFGHTATIDRYLENLTAVLAKG